MASYKTITVLSHDELEHYIPDWQELCEYLELPVSYNPNWLFAWLQAYNESNLELDITFVYKEDKLLAVIPFMIRIERKKRVLKFLSDSCSDYLGIPFRQEVKNDLVKIIAEKFEKLNFTHICFTNIHENDETLSLLVYSSARYGIKTVIEPTDKSLSVTFNAGSRICLDTKLSSEKNKRILKSISRAGNISFNVIRNIDLNTLDEIFKIHIEKWEANKIIPQFSDERRKKFIRAIASVKNDSSGLTCFALYADDKLISYQLGFIKNNIYYGWNTSYNVNFKKYSPGKVLFLKTFQYLVEHGIDKCDFMNGNEKYKHQYATNTSGIIRITGLNKKLPEFGTEPSETLKLRNITDKKCLILDVHGVIFNGRKPDMTTIEGIKKLQSIGIKIGILTNTSVISVAEFRKMFLEYGLIIDERNIMTSAVAIKDYLRKRKRNSCYLIGGEPELPVLLESSKIKIVKDPLDADVVVVGSSTEFSYFSLCQAYRAIQNGADFICSDADMLYASENGNLPGTGWIVSSIASVCNKEPMIIGKPNDFSLKLLMKAMKVKSDATMFVGDSIESDIEIGKKAGIATCLQLGGVSQLKEVALLPFSKRPDYVIRSFDEIVNVFIDMERQSKRS